MLPIYSMPGHLIRRLHQLSTGVFSDRMAAAGEDITPVQFGALTAINAFPGLDQATVAGMIAIDRVTIGGVLDRLEQKGLMTRNVKKGDRRSKALYLTAAGQDLLNKLAPVVAGLQADILCGLTPGELEQFNALAAKVIIASGDDLSEHYSIQQLTGTDD